MASIEFHDLPAVAGGFSDLFLDYVDNFSKVERFFAHPFRGPAGYEAVMKAIGEHPLDRATLVQVLNDQNRGFGSGPKAMANIAALERPTTFAVVTGQQVGLFGGPLYTVFKTISAIKLAETLAGRFPGREFVPVFWLEGEDHDFLEMNHVGMPGTDTAVVKIEYLPGGQMPERNLGAIGEVCFDETLEKAFETLTAALQKTEFTEGILKSLRECYAPGRTFNQAFAAWMIRLFQDRGLVFISSNDPRLKKLLSPLFIKELTEFPRTSQLVIGQSAELEQEYHAQTKAKSVNLFMFHKGGRYLIEPREVDFSLKGTRHFIGKDQMLEVARSEPHLLSPNVVLRPLAQDTLLPTVAYIAGPSEVAYQAQLKPVYEYMGVIQPVIVPRASGSFVEERLTRSMEKYSLQLVDFFGETSRITSKVVEQISEVKVDDIFDNALKHVHDALNELKFGLSEIDPTLLGALDGLSAKTDINIKLLREKSIAAQKRLHDVAVRQVERAAASILPNGTLQEREISVIYFMNKYGPDVIRFLLRELQPEAMVHQILTL